MTDEREPDFREVVPGMLVREDIKVRVEHPTDCFILRNPDETATLSMGGSLGVFSSEENAKAYIEKRGLDGAVVRQYPWTGLVETFGEHYLDCVIDHTGEPGFFSTSPLRRDI